MSDGRRMDIVHGGRQVLAGIDAADQRAERERALRAGELVERPANVVPLQRPLRVRVDRDALVRQYWRWAEMACAGGVPPGFKEEERPR